MKKALLVLALVITSLGSKAEESQLPVKVGDTIRIYEPQSTNCLVFVAREVRGKWVSDGGIDIKGEKGKIYRSELWYNIDSYSSIHVNAEEDLRWYGLIPPIQMPAQNTNKTFANSVVHGKFIATTNSQSVVAGINAENTNTSTNFFPRPRRNVIPIPKVENAEKDAPSVEGGSK